MGSVNSLAARQGILTRIQFKETAIILSLSVMVPFLIHFLPDINSLAIGAILLPMFWAPYFGVKFFKFHVGLIPALAAPVVNYLVTGNPQTGIVPLMTLQLAVFVVAAKVFDRFNYLKYFNAVVSYAVSISVSLLVMMTFPFFMPALNPAAYLSSAFIYGIPGIIALALINYFSVKYN